jgi:thiol-disulfide isomerase/thioredoxin
MKSSRFGQHTQGKTILGKVIRSMKHVRVQSSDTSSKGFALNRFACLFFYAALIFSAPLVAQETGAPKPEKHVLGWVPIDSIYHSIPAVKPDEENYIPDSAAMAELSECQSPTKVLVFFGSWCKDSKRELPRFFAALHRARNGFFDVRYLGLDRSKKDSGGFTERYQITNVPTFVFLRDELEIGRIVEEPVEALEKEWVKILRVDPETARRKEAWRLMREALWPSMFRAATIF